MSGITAYGAYIPVNRLERKLFTNGTGDRSVAGHDEDSVTMAVAAALDCLGGPTGSHRPDLVYFATTTAPYREKQSASTIAGALDLEETVRSADFADSLRAGSAAMLAALDAVEGGRTRSALVTVGDCRLGAPTGSNEANFGDAAAAFVFGVDNVLAEVTATHSITADFVSAWRNPEDKFVKNWEERFVIGHGYVPLVSAAIQGLLNKTGLVPADIAKIVLYAPHPRHQLALAKSLGFRDAQVQDALHSTVGCAGAANAPLMLSAALEAAEPGQRIIFATFGEGADAVLFTVTEAIKAFKPVRGVAGHLATRRPITYHQYLGWREIMPVEPPRRSVRARPSLPAFWRNRRKNLAFYGVRCTECGTPQFPPPLVCVQCQGRDQFVPYRFAGKDAHIATFTEDYMVGTGDQPNLVAVADFDGGGRIILEVTDCDPGDLHIGMALDLTFRHIADVEGLHVYYWKAKPKA